MAFGLQIYKSTGEASLDSIVRPIRMAGATDSSASTSISIDSRVNGSNSVGSCANIYTASTDADAEISTANNSISYSGATATVSPLFRCLAIVLNRS